MREQASLETEATTKSPRWWWWLSVGLVLFLLVWLGLVLSGSRPLKVWQITAVSPDSTLNPQALLVDFDALNDSPSEYANKRIRVSGNYLRLEQVNCVLFSGPRIQWGLVAEGLQLNARGFELIVLPLVIPNTPMTLEGIWRRYPGPAGCGKEPTRGLWYLEVEQIVQPNPLMAATPTPVGILSVTPLPFPGTDMPTPSGSLPPVGGTPIPNVTIVSTVVVSTPLSTATVVGTPILGTPTATPTDTATTATSSPPGLDTPTAVSGTPSPSPTPSPSSTPGSGTVIPTPTSSSLVTATPGGYPVPTAAPSPTPYP
jgi:hypothetical protein